MKYSDISLAICIFKYNNDHIKLFTIIDIYITVLSQKNQNTRLLSVTLSNAD